MADIFISYAREDREVAVRLAAALEARGFSVWWDRALVAGEDYADTIARELAAARVVLVAWSNSSVISPFVRDEAARGRDSGRLAPVLLERVELPLGFGQIQTEDLSGWSGDPKAPEISVLVEILKSRLEKRAPDLDEVEKLRARRRKRVMRTMIVSLVTLGALLGAGGVAWLLRPPTVSQAESEAQATTRERLLTLVEEGKLSGSEAIELARLLQSEAFTRGEDMAAEMFADAAAQLAQDPDARVRRAIVEAARPDTMNTGMKRLRDLAEEGAAASGPLWRAYGALASAHDDATAIPALEQARLRNPQDRAVWRLLANAYARQGQPRPARGSALVADGLEAAAHGRENAAETAFTGALPLLEGRERAFVLGLVGDAANTRQDFEAAAAAYADAVQLHLAAKDVAALSVDASKLARAQRSQGRVAEACATLKRAAAAGASVTAVEVQETCAEIAPPRPLGELIRPPARAP